jgi:hypothetical protein
MHGLRSVAESRAHPLFTRLVNKGGAAMVDSRENVSLCWASSCDRSRMATGARSTGPPPPPAARSDHVISTPDFFHPSGPHVVFPGISHFLDSGTA